MDGIDLKIFIAIDIIKINISVLLSGFVHIKSVVEKEKIAGIDFHEIENPSILGLIILKFIIGKSHIGLFQIPNPHHPAFATEKSRK